MLTWDVARIDPVSETCEARMIQVNLPAAGMDLHASFTGCRGWPCGAPEKASYCREFFAMAQVVHARRSR